MVQKRRGTITGAIHLNGRSQLVQCSGGGLASDGGFTHSNRKREESMNSR